MTTRICDCDHDLQDRSQKFPRRIATKFEILINPRVCQLQNLPRFRSKSQFFYHPLKKEIKESESDSDSGEDMSLEGSTSPIANPETPLQHNDIDSLKYQTPKVIDPSIKHTKLCRMFERRSCCLWKDKSVIQNINKGFL